MFCLSERRHIRASKSPSSLGHVAPALWLGGGAAKTLLVALWQQRRKQRVRPVPESNAVWAAMLSLEAEGVSFALSLKFCHRHAGLEGQGRQDTQTGSRQRLRGKAGERKQVKQSEGASTSARAQGQCVRVREQSPGSAGTLAGSSLQTLFLPRAVTATPKQSREQESSAVLNHQLTRAVLCRPGEAQAGSLTSRQTAPICPSSRYTAPSTSDNVPPSMNSIASQSSPSTR